MESYRTDRIAKEIRKILSQTISLLGKELGGGLISLTKVTVTKDLSIAKLYISIFGAKYTPLEIINYLNENKSYFRNELGNKMRLRALPDLKFFLDDTLDEIEHIQKMIKEVQSELPENSDESAD
ncbi:MAG: ribosome-binding factor A [Ignavibacteria bacterium GWF2_33_9]|nr:MAG: ribosome-binding factor A [Ignavibacteria bacterium GWF2_33_9]